MDIRTDAEKRYDAERDGSAYQKLAPEPIAEETPEERCNRLCRYRTGTEPLATIDGCLVYGSYLPVMDGGGLFSIQMTWRGMELSTDGENYISTPSEGAGVGEYSPAEWARVKELAHTDVM